MKTLAISFITFLLTSCTVAQRIATESREIGNFSQIRVEKGIDLKLVQDADDKLLKITSRNFDLQDVITEIRGETLYLSKKGNNFSNSSVDITVPFYKLSQIDASSGSDIENSGTLEIEELSIKASGGSDLDLKINLYYLECELSGGSDAELEGSSKAAYYQASGGSDIDANDFKVEKVTLRLSGGSDVDIFATEEVDIEASGGSDVNVSGGAKIVRDQSDRSSDVRIN